MKNLKPLTLGFLQAIAVAVYCLLIAIFMIYGSGTFDNGPEVLSAISVLLLLVFSVAVMALVVFGYPVYFYLQEKNVVKSIKIVAYTVLFSFVWLLIALIIKVLA